MELISIGQALAVLLIGTTGITLNLTIPMHQAKWDLVGEELLQVVTILVIMMDKKSTTGIHHFLRKRFFTRNSADDLLRDRFNIRPYALSLVALCTLAALIWTGGVLLRESYSGLSWAYQSDVAQPFTVLFSRLSPTLVASSFWLLGLLVLAFGPSTGLVTIFFLFCQTFAATLSLWAVSASGPLWSSWAFNFLLWWPAPLALHTHLLLVDGPSSRRRVRYILYLYALALVLSLLDLWRLSIAAPALLLSIKLLWVGLLLLLSVAVLVRVSWREEPLPVRSKTGIAALSASQAFIPLVLFSLIPDALFDQPLLSYDITLLALPALPLGYAYAIGRHRLMRMERYVNRGIVYTLVALVVGAVYGVLYLAYTHLVADGKWVVTPAEFGVTILLIITIPVLYRALQRGVDRIFYGRWYDDRAAVWQVSQSVADARGDSAGIGEALCRALLKVLQLEYAAVLLGDGVLVASSAGAGTSRRYDWGEERAVTLLSTLYAQGRQMIGRGRELEKLLTLSRREQKQLLGNRPQLWLLLGTRERPQGLLVLGTKRGAAELVTRDLEILEVVAQQAGAALENELLLSEVRHTSAQLKRLHRQIVQAREEERKRVARNLHDHTIQALVGLNYRLSQARRQTDAKEAEQLLVLQNQVREIIKEVRQVCASLRPPALDALGLVPALESLIAEVKARAPFQIHFKTANLDEFEIPDDVCLVLYRFAQEALLNVQKHAAATEVLVQLEVMAEEALALTVADDGVGFQPPRKLSALTQEQHFGLVGLQEQVEGVGGVMYVCSEPGKGCTLQAIVPWNGSLEWVPGMGLWNGSME